MNTVLGVDACKSGWIGITLTGGAATAHFARSIEELAKAAGDVAVTAIDMPIGLPDRGVRQADLAARDFLRARRSSVFMTPVRATLGVSPHEKASAVNREHTGQGMSIQAYGLLPKIAQVDAWLPSARGRVVEVHPEVSFTELAGPDTDLEPKKTWAGANQRAALLTAAGFDLATTFGDAGRRAAVDDLLDAAVAAWTAHRVLTGAAISLPTTPETFSDGIEAAIWR